MADEVSKVHHVHASRLDDRNKKRKEKKRINLEEASGMDSCCDAPVPLPPAVMLRAGPFQHPSPLVSPQHKMLKIPINVFNSRI